MSPAVVMQGIRAEIIAHDRSQPSPYSDARRVVANGNGPATVETSTIKRAWSPLPLAYLTEPPPARKWLLRHPTADGQQCAPGAGDGMLPLGKAGVLVADGGVGKTRLIVNLAASIPTARDWLGYFAIGHEARAGRVLLALAEEDLEEVHRRMYDAAESMRLTRTEREAVIARVTVLGLAGSPVSLLRFDREGHATPTAELQALRELVWAGGPWSLICFDPLARFGGQEVETNNAAATAFVQAVESFCSAPGTPSVLVVHHASQASVRAGTPDTRGVTGLRNAFRWEGTLRETEAGGVAFKQTKSNYSRPWRGEELALVRGPNGHLRVPTPEEQAHAEDMASERVAAAMDADVERVVAALSREGKASSIDQIAGLAGMRLTVGRRAVRTAIDRGEIVKQGTAREPLFVCVLQTPNTPGRRDVDVLARNRAETVAPGGRPGRAGTSWDVGTSKSDRGAA